MTNGIFRPSMTLQGIQQRGPSSFNGVENSGAKFGAELWHNFIDALVEKGIPISGELYGVSWPADDLTPPQEIFYFCGLESDQKIEGFETLQIDGGNYFEYFCTVAADKLDDGFKDAYMRALPESGLQSRDGKHIEIYGDEYDPDSAIAKFKILIPVQ